MENQGAIVIQINGEKIRSKVQFEKLSNAQVSLMITQLDLLRKKLLEEYEKKTKFRVESK